MLEVRREAEGRASASVRGSGGRIYQQRISWPVAGGRPALAKLSALCTCSVGVNCKHAAAVCVKFFAEELATPTSPKPAARAPAGSALPSALSLWLGLAQTAERRRMEDPEAWPPNVRDRLLYVVDANSASKPGLSFFKASLLKSGGYGSAPRPWDAARLSYGEIPQFIRPQDLRLLRRILLLGLIRSRYEAYDPGALAGGVAAGEVPDLLEAIARTGRGRWGDPLGPALVWGAARRGRFLWEMAEDGGQKLVLQGEEGRGLLPLATEPPLFVEPETGEIGPLDLGEAAHLLPVLLQAPRLAPDHAAALAQALEAQGLTRIPAPRVFRTERRKGGIFTPVLRLLSRTQIDPQSGLPAKLPLLKLGFEYGGRLFEGGLGGEASFLEDGVRVTLIRDERGERAALERLEEEMEAVFGGLPEGEGGDYLFGDPAEEPWQALGVAPEAVEFAAEVAPRLEEDGFRIEAGPDWPRLLRHDEMEFLGSAEPQTGEGQADWFSFGLKLKIGGREVDLAPILPQLLEQIGFGDPEQEDWASAAEAMLGDLNLYLPLGDGSYAALDPERLLPILKVFLAAAGLLEGFHWSQGGEAVAALEALEGCGVAFRTTPELLALGRRLRALAAAPEAEPPPGFLAELRPYQKAGYGWLKALSDQGFGGLLADEMGLGKTVQTLAFLADLHLREDPPRKPSLLVVPTSLLHVWRRQAAQFVPDLRLLILHGPNRGKDFGSLGDHHLVVTSYALLHRDQEILAAQDWEAAILDEAQAAKNPASETAKALRKLKSRLRLALTGTPLENSLGDLWTLVDWLVPGLLGDRKSFRARFLLPIEKQGDGAAQAELNRRLKPFLLRRSKAEVEIDLPEKTEITELVALGEKQAGLYEALRLAMDERVRRAIAERGFAGSRITILDALLKLRQICCDPALLKHEEAKKVRESAKRARLMEMLERLVAEGRRVLVFSQFVQMLDLIEAEVKGRGWAHLRLTGETQDRDAVVTAFQEGSAPVFLISLKAGGVGLTLTAADAVILYDPWWNPAVERQAMDRAHRIGQRRKVFVWRLIAEGSVEQAISELQAKKQALADALFEGGGGDPFAMTEDDLKSLFRPLEGEGGSLGVSIHAAAG